MYNLESKFQAMIIRAMSKCIGDLKRLEISFRVITEFTIFRSFPVISRIGIV